MKNIYYDAGIRIRYLREKKHYTREKLAEMAEISPKFLYEIEVGSKGFSADTLCRLAEALDTNANFILYGEVKGEMDVETLKIFNKYGEKKQKDLIKIMELICKFTE